MVAPSHTRRSPHWESTCLQMWPLSFWILFRHCRHLLVTQVNKDFEVYFEMHMGSKYRVTKYLWDVCVERGRLYISVIYTFYYLKMVSCPSKLNIARSSKILRWLFQEPSLTYNIPNNYLFFLDTALHHFEQKSHLEYFFLDTTYQTAMTENQYGFSFLS